MNTESILTCFRQLKILAQIESFAKIAHAKAILQDGMFFSLISGILCFFERCFAQNYSNANIESQMF